MQNRLPTINQEKENNSETSQILFFCEYYIRKFSKPEVNKKKKGIRENQMNQRILFMFCRIERRTFAFSGNSGKYQLNVVNFEEWNFLSKFDLMEKIGSKKKNRRKTITCVADEA